MKLQPASKREIIRISCGVIIGSAIMVGVFAIIKKFDLSVLLGALLGAAVAIANFYYLSVSVQKAAANTDNAKNVMRMSYHIRMIITVVGIVVGLAVPVFNWVAVVIPLLLPRATILVLQIAGVYRADDREDTKK